MQTASLGCTCYTPIAGWSMMLSQALAVFSLIVNNLQVVYAGVLISSRYTVVSVTNFAALWLMYFVLWAFELPIAWLRPEPMLTQCMTSGCSNTYFYNQVNYYAFPDPLTITGLSFGVVVIYAALLYGAPFPWIVALGLTALAVGASIAEVTLGRMYVGQLFANWAIVVVMSILLCLLAAYFYDALPKWRHERRLHRAHYRALEEYTDAAAIADATLPSSEAARAQDDGNTPRATSRPRRHRKKRPRKYEEDDDDDDQRQRGSQ